MAGNTTAGITRRAGKVLTLTLLAALAAITAVLVVTPGPAQAAFPGSNSKIVFWAARSIDGGDSSTTDAEIFSMSPNGTGLAQLTVNAVQDFNPAWSPNGLEIAFERRQGDDEIYKMAADGSNQRPLTNNSVSDVGPAWSPGGTKIVVFTRSQNGNDDVYTMSSSNGSNAVRLTVTPWPAQENNPDWQPGP